MPLVNHYSFALICFVIFIVVALTVLRRGFQVRNLIFIGLTAISLLAAWFALRPQAGMKASQNEITSLIGQGIPVLLEIQSPY